MKSCFLLLSALLTAVVFAGADSQSAPQGWNTIKLENGIIELDVVPEIGGRVIQYRLGDYGFFWVNEQLAGRQPPAGGVGPNGEWLNYGGDKLWPAPQGWDNDQQWPGPPDAILDGSPYAAQVVTKNDKPVGVQLTSGGDKRSGIQFSRVIEIFNDTTHVSVDAAMKNIDNKDRRWGIWSHTQLNAASRHGDGYNENYWGYCPLNPQSVFPRGYDVMFGLAGNLSYKPDYKNGMMQVHYQRRVGKIGVDSKAGWAATVDGTNGYVFVQRFQYQEGKSYPDNSSVEFWMNGLGEFVARGRINKMSEDPKENPYVFESEMISPYAALKPGESYSFHYDWYAAKIGSNLPVLDCTSVGVICKPLTAEVCNGRIVLDGHCGVFYRGNILLRFLDKNGNIIKEVQTGRNVGPLEPVIFSQMPKLESIEVPEDAERIAVFISSAKGEITGELAETQISRR